jgi:hypothetical protein
MRYAHPQSVIDYLMGKMVWKDRPSQHIVENAQNWLKETLKMAEMESFLGTRPLSEELADGALLGAIARYFATDLADVAGVTDEVVSQALANHAGDANATANTADGSLLDQALAVLKSYGADIRCSGQDLVGDASSASAARVLRAVSARADQIAKESGLF